MNKEELVKNRIGRVICTDGFTGRSAIIMYDYEDTIICECGLDAYYDSETGTYKCECGYESEDCHDNPKNFISVEDVIEKFEFFLKGLNQMNQDELYKDLVYVNAVVNNEEKMLELDGPFTDFEELFCEVERIEVLKNKNDPDRLDQIDLVKLCNNLKIPTLFSGGIKCH